MHRTTWTIAAIVVTLLVVGVGARAMAQGEEEVGGRRTITVTSTATVGSEPDQATLSVGVEAQADESAGALADNATVTDDVLKALQDAGVSDDDVQTERLDVFRRIVDRKTPQERTVFVAETVLSVTVRDLDTVGPVIEAAVGAGATSVRDIRFEVSDPSAARTEALEQAVLGARVKADAMAGAADAGVTGVERIVEEGSARPAYEESLYRASAGVADAALSVVPPDELDTSVTVTVTWTIG